jgi:iron(III) transport system substrate-binding protein
VINIILTIIIYKVEYRQKEGILISRGEKLSTHTQNHPGQGAKKALSHLQLTGKSRIRAIQKAMLLAALALLLVACTASPARDVPIDPSSPIETTGSELSGKLVIYSGRSEPLIQPVLDRFKSQYPDIEILLKSGRNSELANALLEEQNNPQADIFITTELITIQALQQAGVLQSYRSAAASGLPPYAVGPDYSWYGLTQRVRVIMYNTELVPEEQAPQSILDLDDPAWQSQVASANSTNGSLQAQVAAMRQLLGDEAAESWLRGMLSNKVTWFGGHTDVRKAVGAGEFKLGLVNHYYYYLQKEEGSPVGIIFPDQSADGIGLITNLTALGIVQGSQNLPAARALVDFLLSAEGQQLFASLNFEYPLIPGVPLHPSVQPIDGFRLADVDTAKAAENLDETFDLIERVGLP